MNGTELNQFNSLNYHKSAIQGTHLFDYSNNHSCLASITVIYRNVIHYYTNSSIFSFFPIRTYISHGKVHFRAKSD